MYLCDDLSVCLCISVMICLCVCVCVCVYLRKKTMRREASLFCTKKRERKGAKREINKIKGYTSYTNRAYMHGYCMHSYCSKYVNMHSFRRIDVEDFGGKMRKIGCFLYFANVYIH